MALTRNKPRVYSNLVRRNSLQLAAATTVWEGSAVGIDASTGRVRPVVAGDLFAGFAARDDTSTRDVTGATPTSAQLVAEGEVLLKVSGVTATSIGASVFATDDDTFALTGSTLVGEVLRVPASGQAVVAFQGGRNRMSSTQVAAGQALVSGVGISTIGTRIPAGPILVVTTGANPTFFDATHQVTARLAKNALAVRIIFAGYAASATVGITASVAAAAGVSGTDANTASGAITAVTFNGASSGTVPARQSATRPSLYLSDWMPLAKPSALIVCKAYLPASGNTEGSVADFTVNSTDTAGRALWATTTGDEWVSRRQSVDGVTTPANFTSTAFQNFNLIYGIQYLTTEGVVSVAGCGDSIMSGTYSTLAYDSYVARAVRDLKVSGIGVEYANLGWSGQNSATYALRALDAISTLSIQHLIYSPWSPNDGGNDPTEALVTAMRARWAQVVLQGRQYQCAVIPITGIPKTSGGATVSAWTDAEDDLRRTLNEEIRDQARFLDPDIILGNRNAPGQTAAGWADASYVETASYVHPTEAGNEAAKAPLTAALRQWLA